MMINLAIVGTGYWGPNFANVISESANCNLLYCCDISAQALEPIKAKYQNVKITTRLSDILNDKSIQGVIVAVPATKHYEVAKKILLAGKDVLVEKPLATDPKQARELAVLAQKLKRTLLVDHIYLFNPAIIKIRELIKNGDLGSIYYAHGDYTALGPVRIDVSAMTDLAVHFLYTICYLLNDYPTSISAFGRDFLTPNNADVAFINVEFGKKTIFNLRVSWLDPIKSRSLTLVGDKKMIAFDDTLPDKVVIYDRGINKNKSLPSSYAFTLRYGDIILPHVASSQPLKVALETFVSVINKKQKSPIVLTDAVNMVTLLEAAEHSLKRRGAKIGLTRNKKTGFLSFKK